MTIATLLEANALNQRILKLESELTQLGRTNLTVTVHGVNGGGSYTFTTIGTDAMCEHSDTDAAQQLIKQLIERRKNECDELLRQLSQL